MRIDFVSDVACPWCAVGLNALERAIERIGPELAIDMHFQPFPVDTVQEAGNVGATGAVPRRTYPTVNSPWAPPGQYTVRLIAGGTSVSQPLLLRLDPRVTTPAAALADLARRSRTMYTNSKAARAACLSWRLRRWRGGLAGGRNSPGNG